MCEHNLCGCDGGRRTRAEVEVVVVVVVEVQAMNYVKRHCPKQSDLY